MKKRIIALDGVFISEDGVSQAPQLWMSPYTAETVAQPDPPGENVGVDGE